MIEQLKKGYTTGSCSAGAAYGAAQMLLKGEKINSASITLPGGKKINLEINNVFAQGDYASCSIIKDSGDDPDVTHGIEICAKVKKIDFGFDVFGGVGVGTVTQKGLSVEIGKSAINPVPMSMIIKALDSAAKEANYKGGLSAEIFVPKGEEIAKRTFNERLGIIGGISILGTTGIVEPMSKQALIDTIKVEIKHKKANGYKKLFLTLGNYGNEFSKENLGLNIDKGVKCSNYIGEALDFAREEGFTQVLLVGHSGKLSKIAAGVMNTHSKYADCRNEVFCSHSALLGISKENATAIMNANTTDEIYDILVKANIKQEVYDSIQKKICYHINQRSGMQSEVLIFSNKYGVLAKSDYAQEFIDYFKEKDS